MTPGEKILWDRLEGAINNGNRLSTEVAVRDALLSDCQRLIHQILRTKIETDAATWERWKANFAECDRLLRALDKIKTPRAPGEPGAT